MIPAWYIIWIIARLRPSRYDRSDGNGGLGVDGGRKPIGGLG
jgi:hypothetical protein